MRLHDTVVEKRHNMVRSYFRQNPHSGIRQAQEFLMKQGERTMNHRSMYKLREEVRKELFRNPKAARSSEQVVPGLSGPILASARALASMMEAQKVESVSIFFKDGQPIIKYVKQTTVQDEVELAPKEELSPAPKAQARVKEVEAKEPDVPKDQPAESPSPSNAPSENHH